MFVYISFCLCGSQAGLDLHSACSLCCLPFLLRKPTVLFLLLQIDRGWSRVDRLWFFQKNDRICCLKNLAVHGVGSWNNFLVFDGRYPDDAAFAESSSARYFAQSSRVLRSCWTSSWSCWLQISMYRKLSVTENMAALGRPLIFDKKSRSPMTVSC